MPCISGLDDVVLYSGVKHFYVHKTMRSLLKKRIFKRKKMNLSVSTNVSIKIKSYICIHKA